MSLTFFQQGKPRHFLLVAGGVPKRRCSNMQTGLKLVCVKFATTAKPKVTGKTLKKGMMRGGHSAINNTLQSQTNSQRAPGDCLGLLWSIVSSGSNVRSRETVWVT